MYEYDKVYEKVMDYSNSLRLTNKQSMEILNKIEKDLELGLIKERSIESKIEDLAYNTLYRENQSLDSYYDVLEMLAIENQWDYIKSELLNATESYDETFFRLIPQATRSNKLKAEQINIFLEDRISDFEFSVEEFKELKNRLLRHANSNRITTEILDNLFEMYLAEIGNKSLEMVRNQDFRNLDKKFVAIKNPEMAMKFHEDDDLDVDSLICYSYIDHFNGISFLVLTTAFEGELNRREDFSKDYVIPKRDVEDDLMEFIDSYDEYMTYIELTVGDDHQYDEIRNFRLIDDARDQYNPDLIEVEFISPDGYQTIQLRCENIICSKIIGEAIEDLSCLKVKKGMNLVVSYCYDLKDKLRLYLYYEECFENLSRIVEAINRKYESHPTKNRLVELLLKYREHDDFDEIVDTFHPVIFDYFRDLEEFYKALAI